MGSGDTSNMGLIGQLFHDLMQVVFGGDPLTTVLTIGAILVGLACAGFGMFQVVKAITSWIKKEKSSEVIAHVVKAVVSFGLTAIIFFVAQAIIAYGKSHYGG